MNYVLTFAIIGLLIWFIIAQIVPIYKSIKEKIDKKKETKGKDNTHIE